MTDAEAMVDSLSENINRKELTPLDRAIATAQLLGRSDLLEGYAAPYREHEGFTETGLGEMMGVGRSTIAKWIEPLQLQPETIELAKSGAIPFRVATEIRRRSKTPEDEVEVAQAFAGVDKGKGTGQKHILPVTDAFELLNQKIPKEELIERLGAMRDPPYVPPEPEEVEIPSDWQDYTSVAIDGHLVTDDAL